MYVKACQQLYFFIGPFAAMHIWANICYAATVKKGMQSKDISIGIDVNIGKMVMIYIYEDYKYCFLCYNIVESFYGAHTIVTQCMAGRVIM